MMDAQAHNKTVSNLNLNDANRYKDDIDMEQGIQASHQLLSMLKQEGYWYN